MNYTIEQLERAHLASCLDYWARGIEDADGEPAIKEMFDRVGWGGFLGSRGYRNTAKFAWCGHFQSVTWMDIGDHLEAGQCVPVMLNPQIGQYVLASTHRLHEGRKWQAAGVPMGQIYVAPSGAWSEDVIKRAFRPGVTATIAARTYGDYRDERGGHYVTIEKVRLSEGVVDTVEGNGRGELGDGDWGEGVVRRRGDKARKIEDFRSVCHFDAAHFENLGAE